MNSKEAEHHAAVVGFTCGALSGLALGALVGWQLGRPLLVLLKRLARRMMRGDQRVDLEWLVQ